MSVMLPNGTVLGPGVLVLPNGRRLKPVGDRWELDPEPEPQYFTWQYLDDDATHRRPLSMGRLAKRAAAECSGCGAPHEINATACAYCRKPR
jgi:hypothetical protein